ncbi:MAG: ATP synthase F0 subunit C [Christensenellales bacterium]
MLSLLAVESMAALGAGIAIALASLAGALAMGFVISKAIESIAKQPEADGKIKSTLILGLVFIETAIIYALVVGLLILVL